MGVFYVYYRKKIPFLIVSFFNNTAMNIPPVVHYLDFPSSKNLPFEYKECSWLTASSYGWSLQDLPSTPGDQSSLEGPSPELSTVRVSGPGPLCARWAALTVKRAFHCFGPDSARPAWRLRLSPPGSSFPASFLSQLAGCNCTRD